MNIYVKASACISPLETFGSSIVPEMGLSEDSGYLNCTSPNYKDYINPKLLRRMSPIIRNGVTAGVLALKQAKIEQPDAIIVGTSLGCLKDTESFLKQLIEEGEGLPNPTAFIQSTHNTIAGQIALLIGCKNYNFTFSQLHRSFESSLLDAQFLLEDGEVNNVLVGGVDEMNETIYNAIKDLNCYRDVLLGEGAGFFVLSTEESPVIYRGMRLLNNVTDDFAGELSYLNLTIEDIDLVIGGDNFHDDPSYKYVHEQFRASSYLCYKPFVGESGTASAIAFWLADTILRQNEIPEKWLIHNVGKKQYRNILLYNNVGGEQSMIVLSKA